jgi:hypothetical protein
MPAECVTSNRYRDAAMADVTLAGGLQASVSFSSTRGKLTPVVVELALDKLAPELQPIGRALGRPKFEVQLPLTETNLDQRSITAIAQRAADRHFAADDINVTERHAYQALANLADPKLTKEGRAAQIAAVTRAQLELERVKQKLDPVLDKIWRDCVDAVENPNAPENMAAGRYDWDLHHVSSEPPRSYDEQHARWVRERQLIAGLERAQDAVKKRAANLQRQRDVAIAKAGAPIAAAEAALDAALAACGK